MVSKLIAACIIICTTRWETAQRKNLYFEVCFDHVRRLGPLAASEGKTFIYRPTSPEPVLCSRRRE